MGGILPGMVAIRGLTGEIELRVWPWTFMSCVQTALPPSFAGNLSGDPVASKIYSAILRQRWRKDFPAWYFYKSEKCDSGFPGLETWPRGSPPPTCVHSVSTATLYGSPGATGHPRSHEMLDFAELIRRGCPSHMVVPCRYKDGKLCEECDSTKSEHRGWDVGAGLLGLDLSLQRRWRTLAAFPCLTDGTARLPVALLSAHIAVPLWRTGTHTWDFESTMSVGKMKKSWPGPLLGHGWQGVVRGAVANTPCVSLWVFHLACSSTSLHPKVRSASRF